MAAGIDVNTDRGIKQIRQVGYNGHRGYRRQGILELRSPGSIVYNGRIHTVVKHLTIDGTRGPVGSGWLTTRGLGKDVVEKDVCMCLDC